MNFKTSYLKASGISILLLGMLFGFHNCAKQAEIQAQVDQNALKVSDTNQRITDLNTILTGLIDQEKNDRIKADEELNSQISTLTQTLSEYKNITDTSLSSLSSQVTTLNQAMLNNNVLLSAKISTLESNAKILEDKFNTKILNTETSLKDLIKTNSDLLQSQIKANTDSIFMLQRQSDEHKDQILTLGQQIINLATDHASFKEFVSQTYATKLELNEVRDMYADLKIIISNLDLKIDHTKDEISQTLGVKVNDLAAKLETIEVKVNNQGKSLTAIRSDLKSAIEDYKNSFQEMNDSLRNNIWNSESRLRNLIMTQNSNTRKELMEEIKQESLSNTLYTKKSVTLISNSLKNLELQVNSLDANSKAQKDEYTKAIIDLKQEMSSALLSEQEARSNLSSDVDYLISRLNQVELDIKNLKSLSETNFNMISKLTVNFEKEKANTASRFQVQSVELDQKLTALKNDFAKDLQDVANKSAELVKNLGADVQQNFKTITSDIAILKSNQSNLEKNMKNYIETYQSDKAKTLNLDKSILIQRKLIEPHLATLIDYLTSLQLRFVQLIEPDEKSKDFYDEDFKKIANSCDANENASFSNALGLDSFQFLSIEYTKMLLLNERLGNEDDQVFHAYGDLDDSDNLSKLLVLGLLKNSVGSENQECLTKIQTWAKGIILGDKRFAEIRKKLRDDEELERRIETVYSVFENVKGPANQIESLIKKSLSGIKDFDSTYQMVSSQVVLDLVNSAWTSRLLSDRLATLDKIEEMQTANSELKEEMEDGFKNLRSDLNKFETATNARLSTLEANQGAMTTSLKRALDVLISLSDRAGFQDLKAYAIWAGDPLNYKPSIYPNWKPSITMVQHFFSGPKSLKDKSDVCTGNKILSNGGVQSYYQFGKWGPCWVNFRNIPLADWGSEAKSIWFRVFGAGNALRVTIDANKQKEAPQLFKNYNFSKVYDFRDLSANETNLKLNGSFSNAVLDVKTPDLLDYYIKNIRTWGGVTVSFRALRLDKIGSLDVNSESSLFDYNIQLFSPLIVDLYKSSRPRSLNFADVNIVTNINAKRVSAKTGWINGYEAGFLLKHNVNVGHKIEADDLFVEGGKYFNLTAKNGFEDLKFYDSNHDSFIDSQDNIFRNLYVFFDYNSNGVVDENELKSFKELNLEKISLKYLEIPKERGFDNGNDFRFKSEILTNERKEATVYDVYLGSQI